jgi:hypothetical protein
MSARNGRESLIQEPADLERGLFAEVEQGVQDAVVHRPRAQGLFSLSSGPAPQAGVTTVGLARG